MNRYIFENCKNSEVKANCMSRTVLVITKVTKTFILPINSLDNYLTFIALTIIIQAPFHLRQLEMHK